ncbi:MAG: hypothetical protein ACJ78Q_09550 [Chloroflexia bacterium]
MSKPKHLSEQSVKRLLREHVERGVPDDADVWQAVKQRLAEREDVVEQPRERHWFDWLLGTSSAPAGEETAVRKSRRKVYAYAQLAVGLVGLLLLAVVTTVTISGLAGRSGGKVIAGLGRATPSTTGSQQYIPFGTPGETPPSPVATPLGPTATAGNELPYTSTPILPTPIADLATLVDRSGYIVRVKLAGAKNSPPYGLAFDLQPTQWFKPAEGIPAQEPTPPGGIPVPVPTVEWYAPVSGVVTGNLRLEVMFGNGTSHVPDTSGGQSATDYILFLNTNSRAVTGASIYSLVDGSSGVFSITDGKMSYAGIAGYKGQPVEKLQADIQALLMPNSGSKEREAVSVGLEGDGLRLQAPGGFGPAEWVGPSTALVQLASRVPQAGAGAGTVPTTSVYLLDAGYTKQLKPVKVNNPDSPVQVFPDLSGYRALLVGSDPGIDRASEVSLLDVNTGEVQVIYSADASVPQWVGEGQRGTFDGFSGVVNVQDLGRNTFVMTLQYISEPGSDIITPYNWGKVVLVDAATRSVRVLAERGTVAAGSLHGKVLVQSKWIDGELQLFEPPYTGQPKSIAPAGPWRGSWGATDAVPVGVIESQTFSKVAWVEMTAPPGDWSTHLPHPCCSGDPQPKPEAIAIWDEGTGQIQRFPETRYKSAVPGGAWQGDEKLLWSRDGGSLYYTAGADDADLGTSLFRLDLSGKSTLLAKQEPDGSIRMVAEGDSSLYYQVLGSGGQNMAQLMWVALDNRPEGKVSVERPNELAGSTWMVDRYGRLLDRTEHAVKVKDLSSGIAYTIDVPREALTSPALRDAAIDGLVSISHGTDSWAIYRSPLESSNGPAQVLHILKVR